MAKTMTVARLHKQLSEMVQNGQGWMKVAVDKGSFHHALEADGVVILDVTSAEHVWVPLGDGDGGTATRKDGTERGSMRLVFDGGHSVSSNDELSRCAAAAHKPRRDYEAQSA